MKKFKKTWWILLGTLSLTLLAGYIGSLATGPNITGWYVGLNKAFFNPPSWVFAPVWTLLYLMLGVSFYLLLISKRNRYSRRAQLAFMVQLGLNVVWSLIFFGLHWTLLALLDITAMLGVSVAASYYFYKVNKVAAYLLWPYLAWLSFATALNFCVWWLN